MKENKIIKKIMSSPLMIMVLVIVVAIISSLGTSYAASTYLYDSKDVSYDNTRSGIIATDVQGAVDELYDAATDYSGINTRVNGLEETIGDGTLNTTSQTLTGGINELKTDADALNDNMDNIGKIVSNGSLESGHLYYVVFSETTIANSWCTALLDLSNSYNMIQLATKNWVNSMYFSILGITFSNGTISIDSQNRISISSNGDLNVQTESTTWRISSIRMIK